MDSKAGLARGLWSTSSAADSPLSVSWRIHREVVLLLGWGTAILQQFAHPLVAQGVADHSGFPSSAGAPWRRLQRTLSAMLVMTFGTAEAVSAVTRRINAIHDGVQGTLPGDEGTPMAGMPYSARDPALLRWVHATCLDAFMRTHELYVGPLSVNEKDQYCAESSRVGPLLGIPDGYLPTTTAALYAYMEEMWSSGRISVSGTARRLADDLFAPPRPGPARPLMWVVRTLAVGLLPPRVRQAYGFPWHRGQRTTFRVVVWLVRFTRSLLPPVLRYWPIARAAIRRQDDLRERRGRSP